MSYLTSRFIKKPCQNSKLVVGSRFKIYFLLILALCSSCNLTGSGEVLVVKKNSLLGSSRLANPLPSTTLPTTTTTTLKTTSSTTTTTTQPSQGGGAGPNGVQAGAIMPITNECANPNSNWIFCDDFEIDRLNKYFEHTLGPTTGFYRETAMGTHQSFGMRQHWTQGQVNGGTLKVALGRTPSAYFKPADAGTSDYRELYWRFYVAHEPGWSGGGGNKLTRATIFHNANWAQAMIGHLWSTGGSGSLDDYLALDPASGTSPDGKTVLTTKYNDFNNLRWGLAGTQWKKSKTPLFQSPNFVGRWYCIEVHIKLNTSFAQQDGIFEFWIDDQQEGRAINMNWIGDYRTYGLNTVILENYWNAGATQTQERYFDNFVVSTQRIGCQ